MILGTAAFADARSAGAGAAEHGPRRVVVSVDVREGRVTTEGWTKATEDHARRVDCLARRGARQLAYTNVDRDGMLGGIDRRRRCGGGGESGQTAT